MVVFVKQNLPLYIQPCWYDETGDILRYCKHAGVTKSDLNGKITAVVCVMCSVEFGGR